MAARRKINFIVLIFLLVGIFPLFFIGGPGYLSSRSFKYFWDIGHVLFFALFSYGLSEFFLKSISNLSSAKKFYLVFCVTFIFGLCIEYMQLLISNGRSPDFYDLARNQLGCLLAFSFLIKPLFLTRKVPQFVLYGLLVAAIIVTLRPLTIAIFDEVLAFQQLPILSDFETPFEQDRWLDKDKVTIIEGLARNGSRSARVQLTTEEYSGVSLCYFPHNWQGYKWLHFSINNPAPQHFDIVCRIHDTKHKESGLNYADRFNRNYTLQPGWNDVTIALDEVAQAPAGRKMDLAHIELLGLFVMNLNTPQVIYIDHFHLSR